MQRAELGRSWRVLGRDTGRQAGRLGPSRQGGMHVAGAVWGLGCRARRTDRGS